MDTNNLNKPLGSVALQPEATENYLSGKAELAKMLNEDLPLNDMGLPHGIYRVDMLPNSLEEFKAEDAEYQDTVLSNAYLPLDYSQGYPALESGHVLWSSLECEPHEAFVLFATFLRMPETSGLARQLDMVVSEYYRQRALQIDEDSQEGGDLAHTGSTPTKITHQYVMECYHLFFWAARAKAYDMFRVAAHSRQQEFRAIDTQNSHYRLASKFAHRLEKYLDDEEEFWDLMTPKVAIDFLEKLARLQRLSTGLSSTGGDVGDSSGSKMDMQMTLRKLAVGAIEGNGSIGKEDVGFDDILGNPETAALAQELIIKMSQEG